MEALTLGGLAVKFPMSLWRPKRYWCGCGGGDAEPAELGAASGGGSGSRGGDPDRDILADDVMGASCLGRLHRRAHLQSPGGHHSTGGTSRLNSRTCIP